DDDPGGGQRANRQMEFAAECVLDLQPAEIQAVIAEQLDGVKRRNRRGANEVGPPLAIKFLPAADDKPLALADGVAAMFGAGLLQVCHRVTSWLRAASTNSLCNHTGGRLKFWQS